MGTFMGHVLPGSFLMLFSLWHALQTCVAYFQSRTTSKKYRSASYFTSPCCCGHPVESLLKLFVCAVGITGEAITGMEGTRFVHLGNAQHITMFFFFGMTGLMELLHHYKFHLPPNMVYISYIMAFVVEGVLFYWHLHGRPDMDMQVHILLLYVIVATVVTLFVELYNRNNVLPAVIRIYFVLLQGIWFWQVAFILYPPAGFSKWDPTNHEQMMIVTVVFIVDAGISLLVMMGIWFAVALRFRSCTRIGNDKRGMHDVEYHRLPTLLGNNEEDEDSVEGSAAVEHFRMTGQRRIEDLGKREVELGGAKPMPQPSMKLERIEDVSSGEEVDLLA